MNSRGYKKAPGFFRIPLFLGILEKKLPS